MTIEQEARDIVFEMDLHGEGEIKSAIKGIAKALQAKQDRIEELDHILNDHPNDVLRTCYQKIKTLESALKECNGWLKEVEESGIRYVCIGAKSQREKLEKALGGWA